MRGYLWRRCGSVGVVLSRRHNLHLASVAKHDEAADAGGEADDSTVDCAKITK